MHKKVSLLLNIEKRYLFTSLILCLIVVWVSSGTRRGPLIELYDFGEHAASIREMSSHLFTPRNPLLNTDGSTTLRYTPYIFLLGLFKKISRIDLFTLLTLASLVSFMFLIVGIYLWGKEYFHNDTLPFYILITLLFLWGKPFNYSNEYNLRFLSYTLFYPSTITFNLSFLGFYLILSYARYEKAAHYFWYVLCATFIFLTHPLTASFFLLGSLLLVATEGTRRLKHIGLYLLSLLVIFLLAVLWPYYPFVDALLKGTTTDWYYPFRMYLYDTRNIYRMGPALLGLPVVFLFLVKKQYPFISWGVGLCSCIYVASYCVNIRLGERYIFFIMFFLHLALAWYLSRLELLSLRKIKNILPTLSEHTIHVLFFLIIVILSTVYQLTKLGFEQTGHLINFKPKPIIDHYTNPLDHYLLLKDKLSEGDIVLSDPLTSWLLPALTGARIVALYHNSPLIPDNEQRTSDVIRFYNPTTSLEERKEIVKKYRATHLLLNFDRTKETEVNKINNYYQNFKIDQRLMDDVQKIGTITFKNKSFILLTLNHHS